VGDDADRLATPACHADFFEMNSKKGVFMQRRDILLGTSGLLAAPFIAPSARAQGRTEIQFWYGLGGALGERVAEQVTRFNESQPRFRVNANFRGSYVEVMTGAIAAWRAAVNAP
jgi:sn-glycerol 3-phosphate transport system substrate-binding protein